MEFAELRQLSVRQGSRILYPASKTVSCKEAMDIRVLKKKGVAGSLAIVVGAALLAFGHYGPGAAILVAGMVDLVVDGLTLVARHTRRQWKSRRAT